MLTATAQAQGQAAKQVAGAEADPSSYIINSTTAPSGIAATTEQLDAASHGGIRRVAGAGGAGAVSVGERRRHHP
jgi:hypothetical protein